MQGALWDCQESDATMLLMGPCADRAFFRALQKCFIQVWVDAGEDWARAACAGACGDDWQQDVKGHWRCGKGEGRSLLGCRIPLPDDRDICLISMPFQIEME